MSEISFKSAVKHILEKYSVSQLTLAQKMDKSAASISQIFGGKHDLRSETKLNIAASLADIISDYDVTLDPNDPHEMFFIKSISKMNSINPLLQYTRKDLDNEIDNNITEAKKEIVFLGGVPRRKLNNKWYEILVKKLTENEDLKIYLFLESKQNLFWRSYALDETIPDNNRNYSELKAKYNMCTKNLNTAITNIIQQNAKDSKEAEDIKNRFFIYETDLPIYSICIKIDDTLFLTPRNQRRASLSTTEVIANRKNKKWIEATSYIDFFKNSQKNNKFVSFPGSEKLSVFSDNGMHCRGEASRDTFSEIPECQTRVVNGYIFNKKAQLLIQNRNPLVFKVFDNVNLWDKSYGGNYRPSIDASLRGTARRELDEEIFHDLCLKLREYLIINGSLETEFSTPRVIDCGEWRNTDGLIPIRDKDDWHFFQLFECEPTSSSRHTTKGVIDRALFTDVFVFICDDSFYNFTMKALEYPETRKICRWTNIAEIPKILDKTTDLKHQNTNPRFSEKLLEVETAIRIIFSPDGRE